jgi:hypothetical protein
MNRWMILIPGLFILAGCSMPEEAYYLNREFGKHSQASWDAQVLYPDYRYADRMAEGMPGITAEEVMAVRNKMFAEKPRRIQAYDFGMENFK